MLQGEFMIIPRENSAPGTFSSMSKVSRSVVISESIFAQP